MLAYRWPYMHSQHISQDLSAQFPADRDNFSTPGATHQYVMTERLKLIIQLTAAGVKTISRVKM